MNTARPGRTPGRSRAELVADAAIALLAERGLRGLTHRAVDEAAGLPPGSTSNVARTRAALLEAAVRRHAQREAELLVPDELPDPADGLDALTDTLVLALHRSLTRHRELALARYELALEANRRPELRAVYDALGLGFRAPLVALMTAAGSAEPERHAMSALAWYDGMLFSCVAGQYHTEVPEQARLRAGFAELLRGMLGG